MVTFPLVVKLAVVTVKVVAAVTVTVYVPGDQLGIVYAPPIAFISVPPGFPLAVPDQLTLNPAFPEVAVTKMDPVPPLHVGWVGTAVDEHVLHEGGAV
jgi:hypothetical protein